MASENKCPKVQRYHFNDEYSGIHENGNFVAYVDYARLAAKLQERDEELREAREAARQLIDDTRDLATEQETKRHMWAKAELKAKLLAKDEELREARDKHYREFLEARGVGEPCKKCGGFGQRSYPNTTTWMGGIGGQAITDGVCDHCWGTGDAERKGANLREIYRDNAALRRTLEEANREWHTTTKNLLPTDEIGRECCYAMTCILAQHGNNKMEEENG